MSAKFSCNVCMADVPAEDSYNISRTKGFYGVYLQPTSGEGAPASPGGNHLCITCIVTILKEGKRPPNSDSDEIPF